jgi:hypothetical protein
MSVMTSSVSLLVSEAADSGSLGILSDTSIINLRVSFPPVRNLPVAMILWGKQRMEMYSIPTGYTLKTHIIINIPKHFYIECNSKNI